MYSIHHGLLSAMEGFQVFGSVEPSDHGVIEMLFDSVHIGINEESRNVDQKGYTVLARYL